VEGGDAVLVLPEHLEAEAVEGEGLAGLGNDPRLVDDEAGDGGCLLVRQLPAHGAVQIADRHRAVDIDRAVGLRPHALDDDVVLVEISPTISSMMASRVTRPAPRRIRRPPGRNATCAREGVVVRDPVVSS
jgi:hypothetical protein